jgi:hypothetical protein
VLRSDEKWDRAIWTLQPARAICNGRIRIKVEAASRLGAERAKAVTTAWALRAAHSVE